MAEGKKSFIAYSDWKDTFDALPDDKAGALIKHIFAYVNDENPETDDLLIKAVFPNIRNALKRDLKKWDKQYEQRVEAGKKSAEVRKRNATAVNARSVSSTVSVSVNGSVSDNVNEKRKLMIDFPFKDIWLEDKDKKSNIENRVSVRMFELWLKEYPNNPILKEISIVDWKSEVKKLTKNYTPEQIQQVALHGLASDFWSKTIHKIDSFVRSFESIKLQYQETL